jgi:hypothetical protein
MISVAANHKPEKCPIAEPRLFPSFPRMRRRRRRRLTPACTICPHSARFPSACISQSPTVSTYYLIHNVGRDDETWCAQH